MKLGNFEGMGWAMFKSEKLNTNVFTHIGSLLTNFLKFQINKIK